MWYLRLRTPETGTPRPDLRFHLAKRIRKAKKTTPRAEGAAVESLNPVFSSLYGTHVDDWMSRWEGALGQSHTQRLGSCGTGSDQPDLVSELHFILCF